MNGGRGGRAPPPLVEHLAPQGQDQEVAIGPTLPVALRDAADLLAADLPVHPRRRLIADHDLVEEQPQAETVEGEAGPGDAGVQAITLAPEVAPADQGAGGSHAAAPVDAVD